MKNKIKYINQIKNILKLNIQMIIIGLLIPKLFSNLLPVNYQIVSNIIIFIWISVVVVLMYKYVVNLFNKIQIYREFTNVNTFLYVNNLVTLFITYFTLLLILCFTWTTVIEVLGFTFNMNVNIIIISQISIFFQWIIDSLSLVFEFGFIVLFIFDFLAVLLKKKLVLIGNN